jgi:hypothetical protein
MPDGFYFNGTFTRRPSVLVAVNNAGLGPLSLGSPQVVAILGQCMGGQPGVPMLFSDKTTAINTLRSGDALIAALRAFNPAGGVNPGASQVLVVRVNPASQATGEIVDGSAADVIDLKATNWGVDDNQTYVSVAAGTVSGKKLTVGSLLNNFAYVGDNLGENAFSVYYKGAGTSPLITINGTTITFAVTGASGDDFTVNLNTYSTIAAVVAFINSQANWVANVLTASPGNPALNGLDYVSDVAVSTTSSAPTPLGRNLQAIVGWLNSGAQPLLTAVRHANAGTLPAVTTAPVFLSGGLEIGALHLDGSSNSGNTIDITKDWGFAINALTSQQVSFIVPVYGAYTDAADTATTSAYKDSVDALVKVHCDTLSASGLTPRRAFTGSLLGENHSGSLGTALAHALLLNDGRVSETPMGLIDFDDLTDVQTTYPGTILAAVFAGLFAGVAEIGDSITNLSFRGIGLEWTPTATDLENGIAGGLLMAEYSVVFNQLLVERAISTWLQDDTFNNVEIATGINVDKLVLDLTLGLQIFKGKKGSPLLINRVASKLTSLLTTEQNDGVIVGDSTTPAWDNVVVSVAGDAIMATLEATVGVPDNFIGLTISVNAYAGTVTVASQNS